MGIPAKPGGEKVSLMGLRGKKLPEGDTGEAGRGESQEGMAGGKE